MYLLSVPNPVIPELGTVWAGGLSGTDKQGVVVVVVVVKVDPWGLKSQLHLTSHLPPLPLAVAHTQTDTRTNTHAQAHTCAHTHKHTQKDWSTMSMSTRADITNAQIK